MILLGVTGSIAAYKAAEVLRLLQKGGQDVHVVMTPSAARFVGPLTFQSLSGHPVISETLDAQGWTAAHLELSEKAHAVVVVPATAECLSHLARGGAGDMVSASVLAVPRNLRGKLKAPVFIAPAMHETMWLHPATQTNVRLLKSYGYQILGPVQGSLSRMADTGWGRLIDPSVLASAILKALRK